MSQPLQILPGKWLTWADFSKGEKVRIEAHGGPIDIQGIIVAKVNKALQLEQINVWFDPLDMFRQISRGREQIKADDAEVPSGCPFTGAANKE